MTVPIFLTEILNHLMTSRITFDVYSGSSKIEYGSMCFIKRD